MGSFLRAQGPKTSLRRQETSEDGPPKTEDLGLRPEVCDFSSQSSVGVPGG